jgi:hypothetical protein
VQFTATDLTTFVAGKVGTQTVSTEQAEIDGCSGTWKFDVFQEVDQIGGFELGLSGDFAERGRHRTRKHYRQG